MTESAGQKALEMLECVELINKVQNEVYIDEAIEGLSVENWTDEMFNQAIKKHDDTKKELFKQLETGMETWWD